MRRSYRGADEDHDKQQLRAGEAHPVIGPRHPELIVAGYRLGMDDARDEKYGGNLQQPFRSTGRIGLAGPCPCIEGRNDYKKSDLDAEVIRVFAENVQALSHGVAP